MEKKLRAADALIDFGFPFLYSRDSWLLSMVISVRSSVEDLPLITFQGQWQTPKFCHVFGDGTKVPFNSSAKFVDLYSRKYGWQFNNSEPMVLTHNA